MKTIHNIICIVIILVIVFCARQPFFQEKGQNISGEISNWWQSFEPEVEDSFQKVKVFFQTKILARIMGEAEKRKEIVEGELQEKAEQMQEDIKESLWERTKNYFSEKLQEMFK